MSLCNNTVQNFLRGAFCQPLLLTALFACWPTIITVRSASAELQLHTCLERTIASGETQTFTIRLSPAWYAHVVIEQQGADLVITWRDPAGQFLAQMDRPNGAQGPEATSVVAKTAGEYLIEIKTLQKFAARAPYTITLTQKRPAQPGDATRLNAECAVSEGERLRVSETPAALEQAVEKFSQAATAWRALGEPYEEAVAVYGRGWSYQALGDYQQAIHDFRAATQQMEKLRNQHGEAIARSALAWGYLYAGEYESARTALQRTLESYQTLQNPRAEAVTLNALGWLYALTDAETQALACFQRSLRLRQLTEDRRGEVLTLVALGLTYSRLAQPEQALPTLQHALELARTLDSLQIQANPLARLGVVYLNLQEYERARGCLDEALRIYQSTGDRPSEADVLYHLARVELGQSHLEEACARIEASLNIIESLRSRGNDWQLRSSFMALAQDHYQLYVEALMRLHERTPQAGYAATALRAAERARARSLLDQLQTIRTHQASAPDAPITKPEPLSAERIQRDLLDADTALLEYALGEERSYLWVVTQSSLTSYELPRRAEIEEQAARVYELLTARNRRTKGESPRQERERLARTDAELPAQAAVLSRMILTPAAAELNKKRLAIVTHGKLQFIPFATLPEPETEQSAIRNPQSAIPLVVNHEIIHLPSASTLAVLRQETGQRRPAPHVIALVADPVFEAGDERLKKLRVTAQPTGTEHLRATRRDLLRAAEVFGDTGEALQFHRLENTGWEAERIAALAPATQVLKATGFAANHALATSGALGNYRIVHFASHSFLHSAHPELSGIVLSLVDKKGREQDGFLRLHEIYNLKLSADLVVLSACQTGLGKEVRGEGLMSLARGFMYAGAPRVVVSAWAIEDRASATLMVKFYKHLLGPQKPTPAAALRAAQEEMWRDREFAAPYFWGGFALQGDWK